jgi:D-amino-acid oxidase
LIFRRPAGPGRLSQVRVIVVGAGVIGLSVAVRLAERGHTVGVLARDLPPETTSAVAAALWYPYRALPRDAVTRWAAATFAELSRLAGAHPDCGVAVRWGTELLRGPVRMPWWRAAVPHLEALAEPPDGFSGGWRLPLPVADMSLYLPWLVGRLESLGGTLTRTWLTTLPRPSTDVAVVNCTGLAARAIADDASLVPVRGQVVLVEQPGLTEWLLEQSDTERLTYVVPREHVVVVGGTAQEGAFDPRPDPATADEILARARLLVPKIRHAAVVGHRVGLRPGRPTVRLEVDPDEPGLVHCYGHGGAGVTLSWGCADDVAALIDKGAAVAH